MQWANDDILSYKRPNYSLGTNPIKTSETELMSGSEVKMLLSKQTAYDTDKIDQIFLAYQLVSTSTNDDPLVELEPYLGDESKWKNCADYKGFIEEGGG